MRQLNLPTSTSPEDNEMGAFRLIIEMAPAEGYNVGQVMAAMNVITKVDKAVDGEPLLLEEPEWEFAVQRINAHKFGSATAKVVGFVRKITEAPKVS